MQPITLGAVRSALSGERFDAYRLSGDVDELDVVARYLWNSALACALHPALHAVEITFRNVLYSASLKVLAGRQFRFAEVPCWLDAVPSLLIGREREAVEYAKERLRKRRSARKPTPGHLIAKLGFGFWTGLCNAPYEQSRVSGPRLWPEITRYSFVFMPKLMRTRPVILQRFDEIREFRNRVSHHEPVWDRDLRIWHAKIVETIGWMNLGMSEAVRRVSVLDSLLEAGPQAYRPQAAMLFREPNR